MADKILDSIDDYSIETAPNPNALILSMRAFGYDATTAIADIIDNSITANARNIWIGFEWDEKDSLIYVIDDGDGMTNSQLVEAMRLGTESPDMVRKSNDLGRFGLGLKTASFSQCKVLTVGTKQTTSEFACKRWDLDVVIANNKWLLLTPPDEEQEILQELLYKHSAGHGTIVEWENLDKIFQWDSDGIKDLADYFLSVAEAVRSHIETTYSMFSKGSKPISFWINGRKIEMWDPFLSDNTYTALLGEESLYLADRKNITVRPYILPHHNKLTAAEFSKAAGARGWNDQQGFYIYRNNRLIIAGDWLNARLEKKECYRLARIRIDIDNSMDDVWGIDVKKARATVPECVKKDLRRIANYARNESAKVFRHRGKTVTRSSDKNNSFVWVQKNKEDKFFFEINRNHPLIKKYAEEADNPKEFNRLLKLLESGIPTPLIAKAEAENPKGMITAYGTLTDTEIKDMFRELYNLYIKYGKSHDEAIMLLSASEPFMYYPEIVDLFK